MRVTVKGKHMEVSDGLKAYAEKKLRKLEKYFQNIQDVQITQSIERNWHVVEVMVQGDGILLRGEERTADMYASIDQVFEKLEHQVQAFKNKRVLHPREQTARAKELAQDAVFAGTTTPTPAEPEGPSPLDSIRVVRTKRFAVKPMTPEEAALQMELLGHDFFVFANAETEDVNVIYRRRQGDYGLIEPEI